MNFYERNCTQEEQIIDFELTREMKDNEKLSFKILLQFLCEKDYAIILLKIVPVWIDVEITEALKLRSN